MRLLKFLTIALVAAYGVLMLTLTINQRDMLYQPGAAIVAPAQAGLTTIETLRLSSVDGEQLVAWYAPPARADRPLILYFHGNSGVLADRAKRFHQLTDSGYGLLAISYRGYGGSTGAPTEEGILLDAEAAYEEAEKRGFMGRRLVLMGESLGTGVATVIASHHKAAALVLDAPYLSVLDIATQRYPIFPVRYLMLDPFRSDLVIGMVQMPILILHGEQDPIIPIESGKQLFELAHEPKEFIAVPEGGHLVLGMPQVYPRVTAFIDAYTK
ncbi:MAG: alpha/beta fold hydrolase [Methylocystis sp.]